jgi:pyruvate/2-oxoglutarate dehydrogenase complex dihydrolipoamide acyltransferase (E2) component
LTVDHRLNDGYPSALFLAEVVELLEHPRQMI